MRLIYVVLILSVSIELVLQSITATEEVNPASGEASNTKTSAKQVTSTAKKPKIKRTIRVREISPPNTAPASNAAPSQPVTVNNEGSSNQIEVKPDISIASPQAAPSGQKESSTDKRENPIESAAIGDATDQKPKSNQVNVVADSGNQANNLVGNSGNVVSNLATGNNNAKHTTISNVGNTETVHIDGVGNNKVTKILNAGNNDTLDLEKSGSQRQQNCDHPNHDRTHHRRESHKSPKPELNIQTSGQPLVQINLNGNQPQQPAINVRPLNALEQLAMSSYAVPISNPAQSSVYQHLLNTRRSDLTSLHQGSPSYDSFAKTRAIAQLAGYSPETQLASMQQMPSNGWTASSYPLASQAMFAPIVMLPQMMPPMMPYNPMMVIPPYWPAMPYYQPPMYQRQFHGHPRKYRGNKNEKHEDTKPVEEPKVTVAKVNAEAPKEEVNAVKRMSRFIPSTSWLKSVSESPTTTTPAPTTTEPVEEVEWETIRIPKRKKKVE